MTGCSHNWKIRKGDKVQVLTGRDKGKTGIVLKVFRDEGRLQVQDVNVVKRHTKQSPGNPGGIVQKEALIHLSNVALVDPKSGLPTKVGFKFLEDGTKVRYAKKSGLEL